MNKEPNDFYKFILLSLNYVITEDWDCTYIIWYKNNGAIENLASSITKAGLFKFTNE